MTVIKTFAEMKEILEAAVELAEIKKVSPAKFNAMSKAEKAAYKAKLSKHYNEKKGYGEVKKSQPAKVAKKVETPDEEKKPLDIIKQDPTLDAVLRAHLKDLAANHKEDVVRSVHHDIVNNHKHGLVASMKRDPKGTISTIVTNRNRYLPKPTGPTSKISLAGPAWSKK